MDDGEYMRLKAQFLKQIANVPRPLQSEIIAVLNDETPVSWSNAFAEIKHDTKDAKVILKHLQDIGLLK